MRSLICLALIVIAIPFFAQSPRISRSTGREQESKPNPNQADAQNQSKAIMPSPIPGSISQATPKPDAGKTAKETEKPWWKHALKYLCEAFRPANLSNWLLSLFAAIAACIALFTLRAIKEQAKTAYASLVLTQPPKLVVRELILNEPSYDDRFTSVRSSEYPFKPGSPIKGCLSVVNTGATKAVVTASCHTLLHTGIPERLPREFLRKRDAGEQLLLVGETVTSSQTIPCRFTGEGASVEQISRWKDKAHPYTHKPSSPLYLYVLGWVDYTSTDDPKVPHRTAFCRRFDSGLDRFVAVDDGDFEYAY